MEINREQRIPIKRQIYQDMKNRILLGELGTGDIVPSTRELAARLNISRNTVCEAYDMLITEGFLVNHQGAATRVAEGLNLGLPPAYPGSLPASDGVGIWYDFRTGQPDLREFPFYLWHRLMKQATETMPVTQYGYSGPEGIRSLRREIADWLFRGRAIRVSADDIFITAGATQAIHLMPELLDCRGHLLAVEDPCSEGLCGALRKVGAQLLPVPVDRDGILPGALAGIHARAVCLTPSHQFPLGGILPACRRAELIRYARAEQAYLIEDDYDSEFRYAGDPVTPLYSMDPSRVIYVGTFSKTLFPALRIGYIVLPDALKERWLDIRKHADVQNAPFEQAALAELMRTRKFDRHIRAMRKIYGERRTALREALQSEWHDTCRIWGDDAGLHLAVEFDGCRFDEDFLETCRQQGLAISTVDHHSIRKGPHADKLLLGYGHLTPPEIRDGIHFLRTFVEANNEGK